MKTVHNTAQWTDTANALVKAGMELDFKGPVLVITGFGAGKKQRVFGFVYAAGHSSLPQIPIHQQNADGGNYYEKSVAMGNGTARYAKRWAVNTAIQSVTRPL